MRTATKQDFRLGAELVDKFDPTITFYINDSYEFDGSHHYGARVICNGRNIGEKQVFSGEAQFYLIKE